MNFQASQNYDGLFGPTEENTEQSGKLDYQFVPISFNRILDPKWRIKHRYPLTGYIYMRSQVVRKPYQRDDYDLYNRYFRDNKFAAATSIRTLADAFGYKSTKTVRGWIKLLFSEGAFIIDKINVPGKPEPANIYVLGHREQNRQVWYYDI